MLAGTWRRMPSADAVPPRPQSWLSGRREAWLTSSITAALSASSVSSQSAASAISWALMPGVAAAIRSGPRLQPQASNAGSTLRRLGPPARRPRGQAGAAPGPARGPAAAVAGPEQVVHEVGLVIHVDQHVGEVRLGHQA